MDHQDENGILLPFRQDASFFCRCAERYLDEEDLLPAMQYARKAYEMEPDNMEYAVTFAEALNRMHRYEESISVLLLLRPFDQLPFDAQFGLASDFMGMEEFEAAQQCAEQCMKNADDEEYIMRCAELLDLLDDKEELEIRIGLEEGEDIQLLRAIRFAKAQQLCGNDDKALAFLREMKKHYASSDILDMELAMLLYTQKEYHEAEQILFGIFKRNSWHIRAHLLLAILYRAEGKPQEAEEELNRTVIDPDASPEELGYAGVVFLEFEKIDRAIDALERLREFLPYDKDMLHELAYCYLKRGERKKAEDAYHILKLSDESDTVASYYEQAIRTESPESFLKSWSIHYDVPMAEYLARKNRIMTVMQGGEDAIRQVWANDPSFHGLIRWALHSMIVPFRKAVIHMLAVIRDDEAERMLRSVLMSYRHGDDEKQFVFGVLLSIDAKPPFALYLGGSWQYGAVAPMTVPDRLPRSYSYVMWNIQNVRKRVEEAGDDGSVITDHLIDVAVRVFILYANSFEGYYPRLTRQQEEALSAAFVLLAVGSTEGCEITIEMLSNWYQVSRRRLENALQRVYRQLHEKE